MIIRILKDGKGLIRNGRAIRPRLQGLREVSEGILHMVKRTPASTRRRLFSRLGCSLVVSIISYWSFGAAARRSVSVVLLIGPEFSQRYHVLRSSALAEAERRSGQTTGRIGTSRTHIVAVSGYAHRKTLHLPYP